MALGLEFGSEDMSLFDRYADTMRISRELFLKFRDQYGTVKCAEIQEKLLGRRYDVKIGVKEKSDSFAEQKYVT